MLPVVLALIALHQPPATASWRRTLLQERRVKDEAFRTEPTSPMAGVQRFTLSPGKDARYQPSARGLEPAPEGASNALWFQPMEGAWRLTIGTATHAIPPVSTLPLNRQTLKFQTVAEGLLLQVFDPSRPEQRAFKGLRYFRPDPTWVLKARLEPVTDRTPVLLPTSRQEQKPFTPFGRLHFMRHGRTHTLLAYRTEGSPSLFVPFTDRTTGKETYSVGRFLDVLPGEGPEYQLDFNRAYNPLCNYAPIYNCPIPPRENALDVAVKAGEKTYPHE